MSVFYYCLVDRRDFGDLLSADGVGRLNVKPVQDIESLLQQPPLLDQVVLAVWFQDPRTGSPLPNLLTCQDGKEGDWAAWITTFAAKIRPFSAFMRLITRSELEDIATNARPPVLNGLTWPAVGLIIGEVLAASRMPDKSLDALPVNAFESTLSFAMFRAAAVYPSFQRWPQLVKTWETARQATRQHQRSIESEAVARVCATIIEAAKLGNAQALLRSQDSDVIRACREVMNAPEGVSSSLNVIPHFAPLQERMRGSREERVVAFSEFVRNIEEPRTANREMMAFVLGYLASRIAPGTIQHSAVLEPVLQHYSTALLWYGFFAGLGGPETNSRNVAGAARPVLDLPATAKWIARNLLRSETVFTMPTCDVGYLELIALTRSGDDSVFGLARAALGTATVELMPSVWTVVNVYQKPGAGEPSRTAKEKEILASMGEYLDRLREAYKDLVGTEGGEPRQRSLFQSKRKGL